MIKCGARKRSRAGHALVMKEFKCLVVQELGGCFFFSPYPESASRPARASRGSGGVRMCLQSSSEAPQSAVKLSGFLGAPFLLSEQLFHFNIGSLL